MDWEKGVAGGMEVGGEGDYIPIKLHLILQIAPGL